jgi:UDP-N-acetylglucosamine 4,6-dehydratase
MKSHNRYLITGAAGSVGSALLDRLVQDGNVVCAFDNNEEGMFQLKKKYEATQYANSIRYFLGDIRDLERLNRAFEDVNVVIHCAALKHVEMSEINSIEAIETNINGTKNVVNACINTNVKRAVFTSSDKSVNPTSTMGATKLIGERIFTSANNLVGSRELRFSSIRFGNVLDSSGSVLRIFKDSFKNGQPFPITDIAMTRFFLTMKDAVDLSLYAVDNAVGGEIFVKSMGTASIKKLAQAIANTDAVDYVSIGKKVGEKLWEELITDVEALRTIQYNDIYTVLPEAELFTNDGIKDALRKAYGSIGPIECALSSVTDNLSWQQLRRLFVENKIL